MRTTITLEDNLYKEIKNISYSRNISVKMAINLVLAAGLSYIKSRPEGQEYNQQTFSLGKPYSEYDLIKALEAASDLEVAETKRKLEMRK